MNKKKIAVIAGIAAAVLGFCYWQNNMLTVSEYTYSGAKVTAALDGFSIVQVSDLHNKDFGERILRKIADLQPDIIVITGDIVDSNHTNLKTAEKFVSGAVEIAPVYYITGNHEMFLDDGDFNELTESITSAGAQMLVNSAVTLSQGGDSFVLTGLDDETLGYDVLTSLNLDTSRFNVVLAHEPQFLESYAQGGADLVLSGHAHGGQFRIPFTDISLIAPDQGFFPKLTSGVHTCDGTEMVISRGIGNSVIPVRLFNFPEIVTVTFRHID